MSQIIDCKNPQDTSLKRKIIKELHNIAFNQIDERLFYGKRVDFATTDLVSKYKKRLGRLRLFFIVVILLLIVGAITFLVYAIVHQKYDMLSAPTILTLFFSHIWSNYYNEQRLCKTIKYDILKTNYEYDSHLQLILKKLTDKKIVFIFKKIDQFEQQQIFDILNEMRLFLSHGNIKTIILLNEIKLFSKINETATISDRNNQKMFLWNYFNYKLRLEQLSLSEAHLFFNECYLNITNLVNKNWRKKNNQNQDINEIKKNTIADFILATKNISMQQIIVDLNSFIALSQIKSEDTFDYEQLILLLINSCFQERFIDIFTALLKDSSELIWKTIIAIIINNEANYVFDVVINFKNESENWILKISCDDSKDINNDRYKNLKRIFKTLEIEVMMFNDFNFIQFLFDIKKYLVMVENKNLNCKKIEFISNWSDELCRL